MNCSSGIAGRENRPSRSRRVWAIRQASGNRTRNRASISRAWLVGRESEQVVEVDHQRPDRVDLPLGGGLAGLPLVRGDPLGVDLVLRPEDQGQADEGAGLGRWRPVPEAAVAASPGPRRSGRRRPSGPARRPRPPPSSRRARVGRPEQKRANSAQRVGRKGGEITVPVLPGLLLHPGLLRRDGLRRRNRTRRPARLLRLRGGARCGQREAGRGQGDDPDAAAVRGQESGLLSLYSHDVADP